MADAVATLTGGIVAEKQGDVAYDMAKKKAEQAEASHKLETIQQKKRNKYILGNQLAQTSKAGLLLQGTSFDLIKQTALEQEIELLTGTYNKDVQKADILAEGRLQERAGQTQFFTSTVKAGGQAAEAAAKGQG